MITVGGSFVPFTPVAEMIKQQWKKIGVDVDIKELERNLAFTRDNNNENQIITWANDGSEVLFLFPRHALPVDAAEAHMGMAFAKWYASNGASGRIRVGRPEPKMTASAYHCSTFAPSRTGMIVKSCRRACSTKRSGTSEAMQRSSSWLASGPSGGGSYPPMNVFRKGDDFIIITEVPGIKKSDLQVQVKGNTIRAQP